MTTFNIKQNDTKPYLAVTLKSTTGSAIDISAGSVWFNMATNDNAYTAQFSGACNITDATAGQCEYRWSPTNTANTGKYLGEFEINYTDGTIMTIPADNSLFININNEYE